MDIKRMSSAMIQGVKDSLFNTTVVFYLDREVNKKLQLSAHMLEPDTAVGSRSSSFRKQDVVKTPEKSNVLMRVLNCCLLNGGVFFVSINLFEYGLLPVLKFLLTWIFGQNSGSGAYVWSWMQPFLSLLFGMIWVMPLFILSRVVNSLWFQDIANSAYKFRKGRPQTIGISKLIADTLFSLVVQLLFLVQSMIVQLLPMYYIGEILCFIHMCLLYSLYSYEYKWFNMGWELHKRLTYIECNWPYFIGFGIPLAVLTQLSTSYIVNGCIFAVLFPFFILSANESTPTKDVFMPLKLFSPVVAIANAVFSKTVDPNRQPPTSTPNPPTLNSTPTHQRLLNASGGDFSPISNSPTRRSSSNRSSPSSSFSHRSSDPLSQRPLAQSGASSGRNPPASGVTGGLSTSRGFR